MDMAAAPREPNTTTPRDDEQRTIDLARLRRQFYDYLGAKNAEIEEQKIARRYYHGSQWTAEEIAVLKKRKQPVVTSNRIERKINAVIGLTERLRQDPKAYPRTPSHEQGAELATAVLRFVLDDNEWKAKSPDCARNAAIDGIGGIEYDLGQGDEGDPDLEIHIVDPDTFFYDPRSFRPGFADARYMGTAKWIDVQQAQELVPEKAELISGLIESGADLSTTSDREKVWINVNEKRLRMVDHWYIEGGKWRWCLYVANTELMSGDSPFIDEKGKTFPKYRMFSASVDHDGDRYGLVRNLKSQQDEINMRRSKALHILNSRRLIVNKGAVADIEKTRREWARPDGVVEVNPGGKAGDQIIVDNQQADFAGQLKFLEESKSEIENFGPNPALIGQGLEDSSGRAISLLQQAGIAELGPYLIAYKQWKIRVYRDIWNIVQRYWQSERWIRVTDDDGVAQFLSINKLQVDQFGRPAMVNAIGSLDVDIILDEGPDAVNMMADNYTALQTLGPAFAQEYPELVIELSPLAGSLKKRMLDKIQQAKAAPPKPDPKVQAMMAQAQLEQQKAQADLQMQQEKAATDAQIKQAQVIADIELERTRAAAQMQLEREKVAAQLELEQAKAEHQARTASMMAVHKADMDRRMAESKESQAAA